MTKINIKMPTPSAHPCFEKIEEGSFFTQGKRLYVKTGPAGARPVNDMGTYIRFTSSELVTPVAEVTITASL